MNWQKFGIEKWVPITGFEGIYEVSSFGQVRSCDRLLKNRSGHRFLKGEKLKQYLSFGSYYAVQLRKNCSKKAIYVHRLVASHFVPDSVENPIVNHKDGNRRNNHFLNLEWTTKSGNALHAIAMGRWYKGKKEVVNAV